MLLLFYSGGLMQFLNVNDGKYYVAYSRPTNIITEEDSIKIRQEYDYDIVVKNDTVYHFCYKIPDAIEVTEEIIPSMLSGDEVV